MINARPLTTPTIHLNGSSADTLMEELRDAHDAIERARSVLAAASPNGRDYYPQGEGAHRKAVAEHVRRLEVLGQVLAEIGEIHEAIEIQAAARRQRIPR